MKCKLILPLAVFLLLIRGVFSQCFKLHLGAPLLESTRVNHEPRGQLLAPAISITCNATPTRGNVLIACIATSGNDKSFNICYNPNRSGWFAVKEEDDSDQYAYAHIWIGIVGSGAGKSIAVNLDTAANDGAVCDICEYSGIATSNFLMLPALIYGSTMVHQRVS